MVTKYFSKENREARKRSKTNKKKICLIHSKEINHTKGTRLNERVLNALNNADIIVSNSNYTKSLAIDIGVIPEKIIVINPGINDAKNVDKKYIIEIYFKIRLN